MSENSSVKGYNKYFIATDSIASERRELYSPYSWNTQTSGNVIGTRLLQDASITSAKIGSAQITDANVQNLSVTKLTDGTLSADMQVGTLSGSARVFIDGPNVRIVVNDGTTNRVVIGNV